MSQALLDRIDRIERETTERLEKEQAQLDLKRKIIMGLPPSVEPKHVHTFGSIPTVALEVAEIDDLKPLYDLMPGLPMVLVRGTFTTFKPLHTLKESESDKATHIAPYVLKVNDFQPVGVRLKAEWYFKLPNGITINVDVTIKNHPIEYFFHYDAHSKADARYSKTGAWRLQHQPKSNSIRWSTGSNDPKVKNDFTLYWYESETETLMDVFSS